VQSVSVRLIVERERDIQSFNAVATYSVVAEFTNKVGKAFKAKLPKISIKKKKPKIKNVGSTYKVSDLETKPTNHQQVLYYFDITTRSCKEIVLASRYYNAIGATFVRGRIDYL
jgi:DNA topoisomerase IA